LVPLGSVWLFQGRVTSVESAGRLQAKVNVASDLTLLNIDMPRRQFSRNCVHTLYDAGCTLNPATYTSTGSVESGSTSTVINWSSSSTNQAQGTIRFTSGVCTGIVATVKGVAGGQVTLAYPLPTTPATGDAFSVTFGCDHTKATCNSRFGNTANFLGFPYVPLPEIMTGPLSSQASSK
jgi:uncharacterized phage protein (TIGR02218 family)